MPNRGPDLALSAQLPEQSPSHPVSKSAHSGIDRGMYLEIRCQEIQVRQVTAQARRVDNPHVRPHAPQLTRYIAGNRSRKSSPAYSLREECPTYFYPRVALSKHRSMQPGNSNQSFQPSKLMSGCRSPAVAICLASATSR